MKTFQEYGSFLVKMSIILMRSSGSNGVEILLDNYVDGSLKEQVRKTRGLHKSHGVIRISHGEQKY